MNSVLHTLRTGGLSALIVGVNFTGAQADVTTMEDKHLSGYTPGREPKNHSDTESDQFQKFMSAAYTDDESINSSKKSKNHISINEIEYDFTLTANLLTQTFLNSIVEASVSKKLLHLYSLD